MTREDKIREYKQAKEGIIITIKRLTKEADYYKEVLEKIISNLEELENEDRLE